MNLTTALQLKPGDGVALVGGGGKTGTMIRLGRELASLGKPVLLTTTTRMFAAQVDLVPAHLFFNPQTQSLAELIPVLQNLLTKYRQVLLVGPVNPVDKKVTGIPSAVIDALQQTGLFAAIINEADGARKLPFKAPANYEPVIPVSTTLVVPVVGLDALGVALTGEYVHRPELISRLSGTPVGDPVTVQTIAAVLAHPQGGLRNVPPSARVVCLLNKLDKGKSDEARYLADLLLQTKQIDSVAAGSVGIAEGSIAWLQNRVAAVILAAGGGSRFGSVKQLALWQGKPMFLHAVDAALASNVHSVIVVLGAYADQCRVALADRPVTVVENPAWADGQSTSLKAGLLALPAGTGAAIFPLADQPRVSAAIINTVIDHYRRTMAAVVWPQFNSQRGNPVLFSRHLFASMMQVTGDVGAKSVLQAHWGDGVVAVVDDPGILFDVDTPQDLVT